MKKRAYITPVCESFVLLTEGVCDLTVSGINGEGDDGVITIGDGGDNSGDAPGPTSKGTNLWDRWDD